MAEITTIVESLKALNTKLGGSGSSASTKADALKDIYVTLGGNASDVEEVSTVTEMIQKVTEVASGGGGGGDFTTVSCTIIVTDTYDDYQCFAHGATIATVPGYGDFIGLIMPTAKGQTGNCELIFSSQDTCCLKLTDTHNAPITNAVCSGAVEYSEAYGAYVYTGDFTLTVS